MKLFLNGLIIFVISGLLQGCGKGGGGGAPSHSHDSTTVSNTTVIETTTITETTSELDTLEPVYTYDSEEEYSCEEKDNCSGSESDYICTEDDCSHYVDTYVTDETIVYEDDSSYDDDTPIDSIINTKSPTSYTPALKSLALSNLTQAYGVPYLSVAIPAEISGIWWDESTHLLYMGNESNKSLLPWNETQGFLAPISLSTPYGATSERFTQVIQRNNKQFVVAMHPTSALSKNSSFISQVSDGHSEVIQGISPRLWRVGLTQDEQARLYECGFILDSDGKKTSSVNLLGLIANSSPATAQETEVIYGADRSISGCVISGNTLYLSEQSTNQIFSVPVSQLVVRQDINQLKVHAQIPNPHIVVATEDGTLFVSGSTLSSEIIPYVIYKVSPQGVVTHFTTLTYGINSSPVTINGIAYDAINKRLFVSTSEYGDTSRLLVFNLKK